MLKKEKLDEKYYFELGEETISNVSEEEPVNSLGRWYTDVVKNTKGAQEVKDQTKDGLKSINQCGHPEKLKIWCPHYVMPRLIWLLTVYEIALSHVEHME